MILKNKASTSNNLLQSPNIYKQFITLILLVLVTSSSTKSQATKYECPGGCECRDDFSARCNDLEELISSYNQKHNKNWHNFMPIKTLDLSNNKLTKLTNQLEILVNLTELDLSHNDLTQVHKLNFDKLEKLDLSHNRITSAKLKKLPKNVIHLNLAHNEITYLPVDFMKLKKLRSLELVGNPLNCTCNTLHVRNWITLQHVWSDKHILCAAPVTVKGQPWLQARQTDICMETFSTTTQQSKYNWDNYEDDNEIMMGDQPQEDASEKVDDIQYDNEYDETNTEDETKTDDDTKADDGASEDDKSNTNDIWDKDKDENATEEEKEEDEKPKDDNEDFIPVSQEPEQKSNDEEPEKVSEAPLTQDEGSGDHDEGSGDKIEGSGQNEDEDEGSAITPGPMGIFVNENLESTAAPAVQKGSLTDANVPGSIPTNETVAKGSTEDNSGTYILLGILALCLISLMAFVAMKNRKEKNRNRGGYDVEKNGATELQDMDKRLLGKPLDKNGNGKAPEQTPLINEYPAQKEDRPSTYTSFHPPEITVDQPKAAPREHDKSQQSLNENGHVEPVHQSPKNGSIPKIPDSDEEVFHPAHEDPSSLNVSPEPPKRYSPIYTSQSPRSDRYSPVYSPETGRVKIKLTETQKPKTPVVVTRSRSRAGDYVNTPN